MMVVLLLLLVTTASAAMAIQSTKQEIQASGHSKQAFQTKYVSEAGMMAALQEADRRRPEGLIGAMSRSQAPDMAVFNEPDFPPDSQGKGYRMVPQHFAAGNPDEVDPIDTGNCGERLGSLGGCQAYRPWFAVDIYDWYAEARPVRGHRADGAHTAPSDVRWTFTVRGRTRVQGDVGDADDEGFDAESGQRGYHEGANDARAHALSFPVYL